MLKYDFEVMNQFLLRQKNRVAESKKREEKGSLIAGIIEQAKTEVKLKKSQSKLVLGQGQSQNLESESGLEDQKLELGNLNIFKSKILSTETSGMLSQI